MDEVADSSADLCLLGPTAIVLTARSWLGPFASLSKRSTLPLAETTITLVSAEASAIDVRGSETAPLRAAETGADVQGRLVATGAGASLRPGEAIHLTLSGVAPSRPGRYASAVRLVSSAGRSLVVPIAIEVSTVVLWGVGFMLVGLVAAGFIAALSSESSLRSKQVEVLREQQALHEQLDRDRIMRKEDGDVAEIDRDYGAAMKELTKPPPMSFADHRLSDAAPYLAAAAGLRARLAEAISGHAPGESDIDDLKLRWKTYSDIANDLARLVPSVPTSSQPSEPGRQAKAADLNSEIDAYMARFARRFLGVRLGYDFTQLQEVVLDVRLAAAAGRIEEAHERSNAAVRSIETSLDGLEQLKDVVERERLLGFNLGSNARQVTETLSAEKLPADDVTRISHLLDQAAADMAAPAPNGHEEDLAFQAANHLVNQATTEMTRSRAAAMLKAFKEARDEAGKETGLEDIQAMLDRFNAEPHPTPEQKTSNFHALIEAWLRKLGALPDSPARRLMETKAKEAASARDSGDRPSATKRLTELIDLWNQWGEARTFAAGAAALQPACVRTKWLDFVRIAQASETLRQMEPRPERDGWEHRLEAIQADLQDIDPARSDGTHTCTDALLDIDKPLVDLNGAIFRAEVGDAAITPLARQEAIRLAGMPIIVSPLERALTLAIATGDSERFLGREIRFELTGTDPNWNQNDLVHVDFGDGTAPFVASLNAIRHETTISHRYETFPVSPAKVAVTNVSDVAGRNGQQLGEGLTPISILPSQASLAQRISDILFNARFALALLIAGTIYTWRFHAGKKVFGAHSFDYAEAFALGFVVSVSIASLPEHIAGVIL